MATIQSPDGPTETINARRTESLDAPAIEKLADSSTEAIFGRVNVVDLIEKAVLSVSLCNENEELLGHAAFYDYPNVNGVDEAEWETWFSGHYESDKTSALNSLFMHYFVAKKEYAYGCAKEIIRTVFNAVPELHYCYLCVPRGSFPDSALAEIFSPVKTIKDTNFDSAVFGCYRHDHAPVLYIRKARVQDHDDLTPVFNRQSDMLKMTYGDYFLAELIEAQDKNMHCLVAEVDGTAIGFMSICTNVNLPLLNECFELGPFYGLRKKHEDDVIDSPATPPMSTTPAGSAPPSGKSSPRSVKSAGSGKNSGNGDGIADEADGQISGAGSPRSVSSRQSKGSIADEDTVIQQKLSDSVNTGGSTFSLQSEPLETESVKSEKSSGKKEDKPKESTLPIGQHRGYQPTYQKRFVPIYYGDSNVFSIQLFCVDERYEMRSGDFLAKAFELFPKCDFACITVPFLVPEFPLLQQFVRVTPRCPSTLPQELYVFNKSGLLKTFAVRPAITKDYGAVESLVRTLDMKENLLKDLEQYNTARRDQNGTEILAFVAECMEQVVGIAILRREEDIDYIRSHYNIEDFIYFNHHMREQHGHLHHFALNPIFGHLTKQFMKEILRQGHKTCLYYPVFRPCASKEITKQHSIISALHDMVPVRARRQIIYPAEKLGHNAPSDRILKSNEPYALNHINRKLTLEPKVTINARIVVIGASDAGLSFLETFAFCPHLRFNNLTLISPHGLPGEIPDDQLRDEMLGSRLCYTMDDHARVSLRTWVNVVYGKMTSIDRNKKCVIVNNSTVVPYDHLIVTTGQQYQVPCPNEGDISKLVTTTEAPYGPDRRYTKKKPDNVFVINDAYDADMALYWIENNLSSSTGQAIVYGYSFEAYCCIQTLLAMGVSGDRIIMVQPPTMEVSCFNNPVIEKAMKESFQRLGIQIHSGYILAQWNDGNEAKEVTSASFTSETKPIRFECGAFFAYYKKMVDHDAFKAINDACLVFDGKIVIDSTFHTNDVSIRSAGTVTKFQRKYHADQWSHANFNSKEVGLQLANTMLNLFDPTLEPEVMPPQEVLNLIPMYRVPNVRVGKLPGGFYYLEVSKPDLDIPYESKTTQTNYGQELVTGTPNGDVDYFKLHLNQYDKVETVTCFSKNPIAINNLVCLFGIHQRMLNNLLQRWSENLIPDFYQYFEESWCLALFHDRFSDFADEVRELLVTRPSEDIEALEEKIRHLVEEDMSINVRSRGELWNDFVKNGSKQAIETRLLSFLSYNRYHLPMYAKPGMV